MGKLLGGSKSKSVSENQAFKSINPWAQEQMKYATQGGGGISALLGGDTSGLERFKNAMGYDWELGQGANDIMAKRAAMGGLDSGGTLKGLAEYQTGLNNQYTGNYLQQLLGLAGLGQNAGQILTSAGQKTVSTSKSSPGIGGLIGGGLSMVAGGFNPMSMLKGGTGTAMNLGGF